MLLALAAYSASSIVGTALAAKLIPPPEVELEPAARPARARGRAKPTNYYAADPQARHLQFGQARRRRRRSRPRRCADPAEAQAVGRGGLRERRSSYSIIEDLGARKQGVYGIDADRAGRRDGQGDRVGQGHPPRTTARTRSWSSRSPSSSPGRQGRPRQRRRRPGAPTAAASRRPARTSSSCRASEVDSALENMSQLFTQIRAVPHFEGGQSIGFRLFAIRRGSLFDKHRPEERRHHPQHQRHRDERPEQGDGAAAGAAATRATSTSRSPAISSRRSSPTTSSEPEPCEGLCSGCARGCCSSACVVVVCDAGVIVAAQPSAAPPAAPAPVRRAAAPAVRLRRAAAAPCHAAPPPARPAPSAARRRHRRTAAARGARRRRRSAAAATEPKPDEKLITMNFQDVDLDALVKFISEITGRNFILDDRVKGKVTIISPGKISVDEAYAVFQSVLQVKGFTTVPSGAVIKILPAQEAKSSTVDTVFPGGRVAEGDEFVTKLIPLENVDVNNMLGIVQPLVSANGLLAAYTATNTMIIIDSASNIDRIVEHPARARRRRQGARRRGGAAELRLRRRARRDAGPGARRSANAGAGGRRRRRAPAPPPPGAPPRRRAARRSPAPPASAGSPVAGRHRRSVLQDHSRRAHQRADPRRRAAARCARSRI